MPIRNYDKFAPNPDSKAGSKIMVYDPEIDGQLLTDCHICHTYVVVEDYEAHVNTMHDEAVHPYLLSAIKGASMFNTHYWSREKFVAVNRDYINSMISMMSVEQLKESHNDALTFISNSEDNDNDGYNEDDGEMRIDDF